LTSQSIRGSTLSRRIRHGKRHEAARRDQLVEATIHEIGATGSLDVTVGQIAKRAGVSPALAFHYFGGKDRLFLAAMRAILSVYGAEVRGALMTATDPRTRLEVTIRASFAPSNFRREVVRGADRGPDRRALPTRPTS
jgi:TetR/AcrR family transcriptional repressor of bet genes